MAGARRLTPLVGRDAELEQITRAWGEAKRGRGTTVHITGEAGIGKSRLVRELVGLEEESGGVQVWQCSAHLTTTTLHPVIRFMEHLLIADPGRHPLLLVVEDLHWADPTTVELLDRMIANPRRLRVMCVLTFRAEFEPRWTAARDLVEVRLGPLTSEGVRAIAAWASPKAVDPAVLE